MTSCKDDPIKKKFSNLDDVLVKDHTSGDLLRFAQVLKSRKDDVLRCLLCVNSNVR